MSDSRLEKFIYAICSMEVSDLPVPLSRIEKLWNCLITGETPDFEPLSRNEKYLMAMLDRYDISNLPAPMSRGEKLLYKIAVGETDLSDVPGYLSRYEELLKYLIENGGISGDDFEYVLYTLNQSLYTLYTTAEKPVKRAILKGQTLVNIDSYYDRNDFYNFGADYIDEDGFIQLTARGAWINAHTHNNSLVKPNTKYAIIVDIKENTLDSSMSNTLKICTNTDTLESVWSAINGIEIAGGVTGRLFFTATTSNKVSGVKMLQRAYIGSALKTGHIKYRWMIIEYQEGMENWDIPYFRGMTSVKMPVLTTTGKNLFDKTKTIFDRLIDWKTGIISHYSTTNITDFIKVIPNTQYTMSFDFTTSAWTRCVGFTEPKHDKYATDVNGLSDRCYFDSSSKVFTFTTSPTTKYLLFAFGKGVEESFQLEQGSTATSYEPYKSNILTVNEDVTLRSNGDVYDELNLLTGRLTQRIDENNEVLAQAVVKTVDLTVVDQDNQPTQLGTFENITHVSLEAENLIPDVEMEVATRISEELASASPLMDDISTKQEQLNITVDEQSDNVDATLIATTEIYEEIL